MIYITLIVLSSWWSIVVLGSEWLAFSLFTLQLKDVSNIKKHTHTHIHTGTSKQKLCPKNTIWQGLAPEIQTKPTEQIQCLSLAENLSWQPLYFWAWTGFNVSLSVGTLEEWIKPSLCFLITKCTSQTVLSVPLTF